VRTSHHYRAGHAPLGEIEYRGNPSVLIIADPPAAQDWRSAAELAGCRVIDSVPVAGGLERLEQQVAADAVLLEAGEETGFDSMLERVVAGAETGRFGAAIATPIELVDWVAARTLLTEVQQLCEPTEAETLRAIRFASTRRPPRLSDAGKSKVRLQQLTEEVKQIANALAALSEDEKAAAAVAGVRSGEGERSGLEPGHIRAIIRARRLRDQFFDKDLFADPAWDMLLDLMAARLERRRVAVSSLCIAAAVPPTTALRWIKTLCDQQLLVRVADPEDGRRVFIELADETAAALEAYLKSAARIAALIV
jgi:hypothetical protein